MEEYFMHWWAGELAQYYSPFGLTMEQFNKVIKISQYLFGLLGLFELVQFSTVMKQLRFVAVSYFILNRLPWHIINLPVTLLPKMITGIISVAQGRISSRDFLRSIILPHVKATIQRVDGQAQEKYIAKLFQWLADHPLSDSARRVTVFTAFAMLSLGDFLTS